jgi:hypothetical protein
MTGGQESGLHCGHLVSLELKRSIESKQQGSAYNLLISVQHLLV